MKIQELTFSVIGAARDFFYIYDAVAKHMDAMEIESGLSGIAKKGIVLDYIHKTIKEVATNWSYWFNLLSKFIDSIKTIYNIVK